MPLHYDIPSLILKKLQEVITPEEEILLEAWLAADPANRVLLERLLDEPEVMADAKAFDELWGKERGIIRYNRMERNVLADTVFPAKQRWRQWFPYTAAAVLLLVIGTWKFFSNTATINSEAKIVHANDITPGGNRATLTLADGRSIDLSEAQTGIVVHDEDITYSDGASLVAIDNEGKKIEKVHQLMLATPRGGTYRITLSDGTSVWLNSASTLRYPSRFADNERVVELEGEAYFEVAKVAKQQGKGEKKEGWPFRVVSAGQTVEVMGTEFNIAAYPDDAEIKTTLVKGRVQVASDRERLSPTILVPGQQSTFNHEKIEVNTVDVQRYIAWKDGFFYFNGDSPEKAFAQLSRWYDIELSYANTIPAVQFYGKVERNKTLGSLLKILEKAGLEFEVVSKDSGYQLIIGANEESL